MSEFTKTITQTDYDQQNNDYTSIPSTQCERIEHNLCYIFETEMKSSDSIIISYKPEVIKRIASFLSQNTKRSASIGIAGETASGKSTITLDIIETSNAFATEYESENENENQLNENESQLNENTEKETNINTETESKTSTKEEEIKTENSLSTIHEE